ncbi:MULTISPECIES: hypothetical protein [unclassified Nocardioides]|uniref:hypothetical protein n=1 Tax=unclassified Nocardioides TaxID=2615069 RepID=UPI00361EBAEB
MITDASDFRPLVPRRLVSAEASAALAGPGTRFRAGDLVEESEGTAGAVLVQLAARKR